MLPFCVVSGLSASSFGLGLGLGLGLEPALIAIGRPILAVYYAVNPPCSVFVLLMLDREYDMITHSFMLNRLKLSGKVGDRDMSETISEQVGVENCLLCYNQLYRRFWTNVVAIKVFGGLRLWYTCASYFVFVSLVRTLYLYLGPWERTAL